MGITFFEVQEWERDLLRLAFPHAQLVSDKLTAENAQQYSDTEVASCFIYSVIDEKTISALPNLKYIITRSTGFDHIDTKACASRKIVVSNVPE
ncbi:hydroxyacid dehydrogenase, partial [Candidatus Microgenomates bacterium]|nr:hydroxyacid dehydrogenase [Candidatus Microgenomates bacterium]